jgi:Cyclic nucleotide-binding domain
VGLSIILSGEVEVTGYNATRLPAPLVTLEPGAFLGELAQLAGRPALVDATARGPVEALILSPDQLRALLIAEAELGERIVRALILRRVRLLETGAGGPVIVGRADNGDVLRLQGSRISERCCTEIGERLHHGFWKARELASGAIWAMGASLMLSIRGTGGQDLLRDEIIPATCADR